MCNGGNGGNGNNGNGSTPHGFFIPRPPAHRQNCCPSSSPMQFNHVQKHHALNCAFCLGRNPDDKIAHTHCVRDRNGAPWCPFLPLNICTVCFHKGHTGSYCMNRQKVMQSEVTLKKMEIERESRCDDEDFITEYYNLQLEVEVFRLRRMLAQQVLNGELHGNCKYCRSLHYYKHTDIFMNNHSTKECPRIALFKCNYCGERGHNVRHCKKNWADNSPFVFGMPQHKRPPRWQNVPFPFPSQVSQEVKIEIEMDVPVFTLNTQPHIRKKKTEKEIKLAAAIKKRNEANKDTVIGERPKPKRRVRKMDYIQEEIIIDWGIFDDEEKEDEVTRIMASMQV